jgi:hypothetical protein
VPDGALAVRFRHARALSRAGSRLLRAVTALAGALALGAALTACGGGGSSSPAPSAPGGTPTPTPNPQTVVNGAQPAITLDEDPSLVVGDTSAFGTIVGATGTATIDGLACGGNTVLTHYHVHMDIFVNGHQYAIPAGTGIFHPTVVEAPYFVEASSSGCTYPNHVHALMGMIHIESPLANAVLTVGDFLDVWNQKLSTGGFGSYTGTTRWFDTDETTGNAGTHPVTELTGSDPHTVNMTDHHDYTIEVGPTWVDTPNYTWSSSYP